MRFEIRALQQRLGTTSVYVTHSQEEALALSDRIIVMRDGEIAQAGTPSELYECPRTAFVAGFIGLANILTLEDAAGDCPLRGRLPGGPVLASAAGATGRSGTVQVSIRPADIRILPGETPPEPGHNTLAGTVRSQVLTGSILDIFVTLEDAAGTTVRVQSLPPAPAAPGTRVTLAVDPARTVTLED